MINIRQSLLLLLALMFTLPASADKVEPYSGSRIFWDSATRKTVFNSAWYSRIIQLQDNRLMACAESGGIVISFSSDSGSTWDDPIKIVNNANNIPNCVPDLIQLSDGTIIVAYNPRPNTPYTEDRKFGIRCKRSVDNGRTWSNEIFVNDAQHTFDNGCWEPSMLELPSGELHLYFADEGPYTSSNEQQISLCRSFDKGVTWSKPQKISFRAGYRDGMPVPLLLQDSNEIVVVIEDNGWPGINNFYPTTVRCTLDNNWADSSFIDADNNAREKTLDNAFVPASVNGGAPYIRQLPWGETVISFQGNYTHGSKLTMQVAVGDNEARHFKALSQPFVTSSNNAVMWNSLAVVDTGIVVAVGGVNNNIEMIKGYPKRLLQAPFATPKIDGRLSKNEGYYLATSTQIILGTQTGTRTTADFCYDSDSLYFIARVSDGTQMTNDLVRLLLDVDDCCDERPQTGCYSIQLSHQGKIVLMGGNKGNWKSMDADGIRTAVSRGSTYYLIEAAIPWSVLGCAVPPVGRRMAVAVEVQDKRESTQVTERIPDAQTNAPWTWMEFRLIGNANVDMIKDTGKVLIDIHSHGNKLEVKCDNIINKAAVYTLDGRLLSRLQSHAKTANGMVAYHGVCLLNVKLADGGTVNRKISL